MAIVHEVWRPAVFLQNKPFDGDSWWFRIDLGYRCECTTKIRLRGFNAPERGTETAEAATRRAHMLLTVASRITIRSYRATYDRWESDVQVDGQDLATLLKVAA